LPYGVVCVLPVVVNYSSLDTISPHMVVDRAFSVAGPAAWNCLCDELREPLLTANSFRQLVKTRLFAEY